jgi:hypothetical protein
MTLIGATPGNTTTTHDTKPQLGGPRIFSYLGNEARSHKGKDAENEIEKFVLACSVHHPSTTSSYRETISGDPEKMTSRTLRTWNRRT